MTFIRISPENATPQVCPESLPVTIHIRGWRPPPTTAQDTHRFPFHSAHPIPFYFPATNWSWELQNARREFPSVVKKDHTKEACKGCQDERTQEKQGGKGPHKKCSPELLEPGAAIMAVEKTPLSHDTTSSGAPCSPDILHASNKQTGEAKQASKKRIPTPFKPSKRSEIQPEDSRIQWPRARGPYPPQVPTSKFGRRPGGNTPRSREPSLITTSSKLIPPAHATKIIERPAWRGNFSGANAPGRQDPRAWPIFKRDQTAVFKESNAFSTRRNSKLGGKTEHQPGKPTSATVMNPCRSDSSSSSSTATSSYVVYNYRPVVFQSPTGILQQTLTAPAMEWQLQRRRTSSIT